MGNNRCPRCQHYNCNNLGVVAVPIARRGGGNAFLCEYHARGNLDSYSSKNLHFLGNPKKNGLTYSMELELMRPSVKALCELGIADFRATSDCTVDAELKSPIYNGACALKAILPSIQKLKDTRELTIDEHCGTHLHIGRADYNHNTRDALLPFYWTIHGRLWEAMEAEPEKMEAIFGRGEGKWSIGARNSREWYRKALRLNSGYATESPLEAHPAFLNVQHVYTLEWRMCFFRSAEQYSNCIDLCRALSNKIFDFAHEIVTAQQSDSYNEAYFMTKAKKLGNKLATIFKEW